MVYGAVIFWASHPLAATGAHRYARVRKDRMMSSAMGEALDRLESVVRDRLAAGEAEASYVASLAAKGRGKIAQKLGEEAVETVIAALTEDDTALTGEAADLVFHLTILLAERGLSWDDIAAEMARRHGTSGHPEKDGRMQ